ncbi:hypothetical protein EIM50_23920 [Pseudoxanthomonas sp. SGD-10]|nr:hypothetical protein EIM50_23920 [Pseudoxanthomonas sp. SGD-10]
MNGINFITDDKGNNKALILDLLYFKKEGINAETVIAELGNLQKWIDEVEPSKNKPGNDWATAKSKLANLK